MNAGAACMVLCPMYRKNRANAIFCEGLTDDSGIAMRYESTASCSLQVETFCKKHFKRCEVYEAIMKAKYADEYEEEQTECHAIGM